MLSSAGPSPVIERDQRGRNIALALGAAALLAAGGWGYTKLQPGGTFKAVAAAPAVVPKAAIVAPVMDEAGVLSDAAEAQLTQKIVALKAELGPELVVLTVPSLGGQSIESYSLARANHMGLGDKERNDGLLLLIAPNEHKIRIEVGRGLTTVLSNDAAADIIRQMLPLLRLGQYDRAAIVAVDAITADLCKLKSFLPRKAA